MGRLRRTRGGGKAPSRSRRNRDADRRSVRRCVVYVPPADPPHGERQLQLCALIEAHTGSDFEAASDLLTRTSKRDDVAPDVSIYPKARHPRTGRRQLEQLAFEVVST